MSTRMGTGSAITLAQDAEDIPATDTADTANKGFINICNKRLQVYKKMQYFAGSLFLMVYFIS